MLEETLPAIKGKTGGKFEFEIRNHHRTVGAMLSGEIARRYGNEGMYDAPLDIHLRGTAGQSFGAWNVAGLNLDLVGDANDYVGKGMAGGRIVIRPSDEAAYEARDTVIIGAQHLVRFGEPQFPGATRVLDRAQRTCARASVIP